MRQVTPLAYSYGSRPGRFAVLSAVVLLAVLAIVVWVVLRRDSDSSAVVEVPDGQLIRIEASTAASRAPDDELAILQLVNERRSEQGLSRLAETPALSFVAGAHSADMYREGYFGHLSPAGETLFDRLQAGGISYTSAGEVLALAPSAREAFAQFLSSPDHRDRLLDPAYCEVGIGAYSGPDGLVVTVVLVVDRPYGWPPSRGCPPVQ
jgi:uncharacterized protein YkwD